MDKAARERAIAAGIAKFYRSDMRVLILRMLALASLLLMLFSMAAAPAAPVQEHRMATPMPMEHCPDGSQKSNPGSALATCTMVCSAALPAVSPTPGPSIRIDREALAISLAPVLSGIELEIATPPPRLS